jgi:hypothetical protein
MVMTPTGIEHAMKMHDYLHYAVSGISSLSSGKLPTLTITGNNRHSVMAAAARTRRLGGYWHQSKMRSDILLSTRWVITLDRIDRRKV